MILLVVLNHPPDDGTDVAWNALRLAETAVGAGGQVRLFPINNGVDAARAASADAEFNLAAMASDLARRGASAGVRGTCLNRCGLGEGALAAGAERGGMRSCTRGSPPAIA